MVQAAQRTDLSFQVSGVVTEVLVNPGKYFSAGDALARLDAQRLALILEQRESELDEADVKQGEAGRDLVRKRQLHEKQWIADAALESARAAHDAARSRVEALEAAVKRARQDLNDATLRAPYAGAVTEQLIEPSQQIQAGQTAFRIEGKAGGAEVVVAAPESLVNRIATGSVHDVALSNAVDERLRGTVTEIAAQSDAGNAYPVTLSIETLDGFWRSGMTAEVSLLLANTGSPTEFPCVRIPITAFAQSGENGAMAFRYDETTETVRQSSITIAELTTTHAILSDGLVPGDTIASKGVAFLRDGQTVTLLGNGAARYNP